MRRTAALLSCLLALAARADEPRLSLRIESAKYAELLCLITAEVGDSYVRPVPQDELLTAAVRGLYDAAGKPVPGDLADAVRLAVKENRVVRFLTETRERLGRVEPLAGEKALLASTRALVRGLDAYSAVLTPAERDAGDGSEQNEGVGLELAANAGAGPLAVRVVVPGGPAQRAGVRPGDLLTHIDGKKVDGLTAATGLATLNGAPAGLPPLPSPNGADAPAAPAPAREVVVTLRRGAAAPRDVRLTRESFRAERVFGWVREPDNSWNYWLDAKKRIAFIRLGRLAHGSAEELQEVLFRLDLGEGLNGLVLDLRGCPGGFLREALAAASLFLAERTPLATVKDRSEETRSWTVGDETPDGVALAQPVTRYVTFPIAVVVNGDTTGGGELIAAALADAGRAVVVGQRTRGKASIQKELETLPLPRGTALKLTTGLFMRPSGANLNRFADSGPNDVWGVRPDAGWEVRVSPELARRLREAWERQTLRPGKDGEPLPFDDPAADPQLAAAWKALRDRLKGGP